MAAALKPSLRGEMVASAYLMGQHSAREDSWFAGLGGGVTAVAGEDFSVDDLLDFSNGELEGGEEGEEKESLSVSSADGIDDDNNSNSGSFSCTGSSDDSESILAGGLAVPDDDIAQLEWVSRFVDDSLSEFPLLYPTPKWKTENDVSKIRFQPVFLKPPRFPSPVPVKTRSKRPRTAKQPSTSPQLSESSSTSSCSTWSSSSMECLLTIPRRPEGKRIKKTKHTVQTGSVLFQRKCSHCGVQKTPQWRAGPLGAKTLCNACGVRYKSGRLFPEYRPACSPTFSVEIHSNSHRKVLEMRRKKDVA
ncbi:hypothetical protein CRG98_024843 [Punica granatum]|nr:hypothetical protein CRG98_024843 [Punica granatum]